MTDKYVLDRSSTEARRLDRQHEIWTKNLSYLLHPGVKALIMPTSHIADIGCGTGRFLDDLAAEVPETCQLVGFDISPAQFPPEHSMPSNITLHVHNALTPFPPHLYGQFDVVHLRLLVAALDPTDWAVLASHACALLKPGGAIQWDEGDLQHLRYYRGGPTGTVEAGKGLEACVERLLQHRWAYGWSTLPDIFSDMGLRVVRDMVSSDRDVSVRRDVTEIGLATLLEVARSLAEKGDAALLGDIDAVEEFERRVYEELRNGLYLRYDIHVCVGFKHA